MSRKRRTDSPTRGEVTEKVKKSKEEMTEKVESLDTIATDTETVRETLENLDFDGTAEGSDAVEEKIEETENLTIDIFDGEDENLEAIQSDTEEYEGELQERSDSLESDSEKVSEATDRIATEETNQELERAKTEIHEDMEFLDDQNETANQAREENEQLQVEYRGRVHVQGGERS